MWDLLGGYIWGILVDALYGLFGKGSTRRATLSQDAVHDLLAEVDPLGWALRDDAEQRYAALAAELLITVRSAPSRAAVPALVVGALERADTDGLGVRRVRTIASRLKLMKRRG